MSAKNKTKKFSEKKYYKLVSLLLIFPLWWAFSSHSIWPIVYFCLFGIFGMLGEIIFSEWWAGFYQQPLYKYSVQGIVHSYSAKINFIPWGVAGLLYLWIVNFFYNFFPSYGISLNGLSTGPFYYLLIVCFFAGVAFQFMIRAVLEFFHPRSYKFKRVGFLNHLLFLFPFLFALVTTGILYSKGLIWLALAMGVLASLLEYFYGKILENVMGKKFWLYKPLSFDGGHFTPLVIVPFAMMGFYFWAIYGAISLLIKTASNV